MSMPAQVADDETRRIRSRAMLALHQEWAAKQIAAGVDGPVPPGRKDPSDYNEHFPDLEASGEAMDEFHDRARKIMGIA